MDISFKLKMGFVFVLVSFFISVINVGRRIKTAKINSFNLQEMICHETDLLLIPQTGVISAEI